MEFLPLATLVGIIVLVGMIYFARRNAAPGELNTQSPEEIPYKGKIRVTTFPKAAPAIATTIRALPEFKQLEVSCISETQVAIDKSFPDKDSLKKTLDMISGFEGVMVINTDGIYPRFEWKTRKKP